jgi:hypothetical protein
LRPLVHHLDGHSICRAPRGAAGMTLLEILLVAATILVVGGLSVAALHAATDRVRVMGAARTLASRLTDLRVRAITSGQQTGLYFREAAGDVIYQPVMDGNGNGLSTADVASGVDRALGPPERLSYHHAGVRFGVSHRVPAPDDNGSLLLPGSDPVRIGASSFVSFSRFGTGSSGTLYVTGRGGRQAAVRAFGTTGRVRVFEFDTGTGTWRRP